MIIADFQSTVEVRIGVFLSLELEPRDQTLVMPLTSSTLQRLMRQPPFVPRLRREQKSACEKTYDNIYIKKTNRNPRVLLLHHSEQPIMILLKGPAD